jgi:hypothetical protein
MCTTSGSPGRRGLKLPLGNLPAWLRAWRFRWCSVHCLVTRSVMAWWGTAGVCEAVSWQATHRQVCTVQSLLLVLGLRSGWA